MSEVKAYHHTWVWEGRSNSFKITACPLPESEKVDIVETAKERAESTILGELASECLKQGVAITLRSCDVYAEVILEKTRSYQVPYVGTMTDYYYHVDVKTITLFDTDESIAESPIVITSSIIIAIGIMIATILAGWGLYTFLTNISTRKSEVKTTTEWYDPETGELTKKEETTETTTEPPLATIGGTVLVIIAVVGLLLLFLVGFPRRR